MEVLIAGGGIGGLPAAAHPAQAGHGTALINFVVLASRAEPAEGIWTTARPLAEFRRDHKGWHEDVTLLIEAIEAIEAIDGDEALPGWRPDRAILIGDAAHPTMPEIAQGAAMAIEDASALAERDQWLYNDNPMTVPLPADAALQ